MTASEVEMAASALRAKPRPSRRPRASEQAGEASSLTVEDRRALVLRETHALLEAASKSDEVCYFLKNAVRHLAAQAEGMHRARGARVHTSAANASGISYMPFPPNVQVAVPLDPSLNSTNVARVTAVYASPPNGDSRLPARQPPANAGRQRARNGQGRGGRGCARNAARVAVPVVSTCTSVGGSQSRAPASASHAQHAPASVAAAEGLGQATGVRDHQLHAAVATLASATCTGHGTGSSSDTADPDNSDESCESSSSEEESVAQEREQGAFLPNLARGSQKCTRMRPTHGPTSGKKKNGGKRKRRRRSDGNPVRKKSRRAKDYVRS